MPSRRAVFPVLLTVIAWSAVLAQEPIRLPAPEPASNWTAPVYWSPPSAVGLERLKESGVVESTAIEAVPTPPLPFTGINPCRLVDTRGNGFSGAYGPPSLVQGSPRNFTLVGQCGIAAGAQAVSLNITVTNTLGPGFILIYLQGGAQPNVSTLNYVAGQTVANAAVVPLGTGGGVTVIAGVSATDLIIDTNGYYAPQSIVNTVNGLSGAVTLAAGSGVSVTPSGQTLTIANTAPAAWSLTGNAGTSAGTNFLGTTDNQALEIKLNNYRVMRFEPADVTPNLVGGSALNTVTPTVVGATISGGGGGAVPNRVTDFWGTVGGGLNNRAGDDNATVNDASNATVGGGNTNVASASSATVVGGSNNVASGVYSTVLGGSNNSAAGSYSLAAGRQAKALHGGVFVWADGVGVDIASTNPNQFIVRAGGGIWLGTNSSPSFPPTDFLNTSTGAHLTSGGAWTNSSDFARKENFEDVDRHDVLARLAALPITKWSYKAEDCSVRHMGPTGQDFAAAFELGTDDTSIATVDADGVSLAAIQALYEIVREKESEIRELRARLSRLEGIVLK